jgi:hypothetical protein
MPKRPSEGGAAVPPRAAAVVFAVLLLATVVAFGYAQRVKRDPLVLDRVSFVGAPRAKGEPVKHAFVPGGCRYALMRIRFRTTISDRGTVQVIKPGGRVVVTLARDTFLKRYTFHTYYWDGRRRRGVVVARRGRYKLRVRLGDRVLVPPGVIRLHRPRGGATPRCANGASGSGHAPLGQEPDAGPGPQR